MTPTPSPAAVYRMSGRQVDQYEERQPEFPCWVYALIIGGHPKKWLYYTYNQGSLGLSFCSHWSPDAPEAPKEAPDDGWEARDQEANGYPIPAPTPLSPAEGTPLEGVNTVGWPASKMQDHVFDCHEEIRGLRDQLTAARRDLANQERTTDAYYKEMHGPDGYRVRLDAAESQLISARRESEGLRAERDEAKDEQLRLVEAMKETARFNHEQTAQFKAEEVAEGFIHMILMTTWDRDQMTRILEGWLVKSLSASIEEQGKDKERDTERICALTRLYVNCPHAEITYNDNANDGLIGWQLEVYGSEPLSIWDPTLRGLLDQLAARLSQGQQEGGVTE